MRCVSAATLFGVILVLAGAVRAQNSVQLDWRTLETDHFRVYYHQGEDRIAQVAARIAEEAYGPVTQLYAFEPEGRVHLVLKDSEDASNGAAYYYDNLIEIWATPLEFDLRGTHDWLSNVITHEFTHIVSLQAARKGPRWIPAAYLQYFDYQEEEREDVLTGYPNVVASYVIPGISVPNWFAEGVSQYQAHGARRDSWDTHRDMVLRTAVLGDGLLTLSQMGVFNKNTLGDELVYNHGYSLVAYIARQYGEDKLREILKGMRAWWRFDFDGAVRHALGVSEEEVYRAWKADLRRRYADQTEDIRGHLIEGEPLHNEEEAQSEGFSNGYPVWSPDGERLAYISTKGQDYYLESLYVLSVDDKKEKLAVGAVASGASWTPSGEALIFSKKGKPDRYGARFWDLHRYELRTKKTRAVTHGLRGQYPDCAPNGKQVVFVQNGEGRNNLGVVDTDGTHVHALTRLSGEVQLYHPKWSPDGARIAFSIFEGTHRDIAVIDSSGGGLRYVAASGGTDRDPCWTPDGKGIVFASDVTGIFNLYVMDLENGQTRQLTNVLGGAFSPAVSPTGEVAFSLWGPHGQELRLLQGTEGWRTVDPGTFACGKDTQQPAPTGDLASRPYGGAFVDFSLMPRVYLDDGRLKLGAYAFSRDVLQRQALTAGVGVGTNLDVDAFGLYEFNRLLPTLFLEGYHQTRHVNEDLPDPNNLSRVNEIIYSLNEVDLGARYTFRRAHALSGALVYSVYRAKLRGVSLLDDGSSFAFHYTYMHGIDLAFSYRYQSFQRRTDEEINPRGGREVSFRYDRMYNHFLEDFKQAEWVEEVYRRYAYHQLMLDWREHFALPWYRNTLALRVKLGHIDRRVDPFFKFHLGGPTMMRGYTYYSLEGRKMAMGSVTYRSPLIRSIGRRVGPLYADKLYAAVFADVGRAWDADAVDFKSTGFKRDVGAQLRLDLVSYYSFPLGLGVDAAYGLDEVEGKAPWKWYVSLLFGYN